MRYDISILGERIRKEREQIAISRERLAELIGISSSFLGLVERGDRKLSLEKLCLVAETFNLPLDNFLTDSAESNRKNVNNEQENNFDLVEIKALLNTCSNTELRYIKENIQLIKRLSLLKEKSL